MEKVGGRVVVLDLFAALQVDRGVDFVAFAELAEFIFPRWAIAPGKGMCSRILGKRGAFGDRSRVADLATHFRIKGRFIEQENPSCPRGSRPQIFRRRRFDEERASKLVC